MEDFFFAVQRFVSPDSLNFIHSIFFLVAIVSGGLGTILGSVIGALFLTFQVKGIIVLAGIIARVGDLLRRLPDRGDHLVSPGIGRVRSGAHWLESEEEFDKVALGLGLVAPVSGLFSGL